jgi:hypothetical protein
MKKAKYIVLALFVLPLIIKTFINDEPVSIEVIGVVAVISLIIIFFDVLEKTRKIRTARWIEIKGNKKRNAVIFAAAFGLPLSLILSFVLSDKMNFIQVIFFLIIPVTLIFAWTGANEWNQCYKIFLEKKYSTKL